MPHVHNCTQINTSILKNHSYTTTCSLLIYNTVQKNSVIIRYLFFQEMAALFFYLKNGAAMSWKEWRHMIMKMAMFSSPRIAVCWHEARLYHNLRACSLPPDLLRCFTFEADKFSCSRDSIFSQKMERLFSKGKKRFHVLKKMQSYDPESFWLGIICSDGC